MIQQAILLLPLFLQTTLSIQCFECDSSENFPCSEYWNVNDGVAGQFINDCAHVFEAQYCIKMTGVFEGKLGTKRFCSARDWGNYCEYIKRPGDIQEYRSCVFSCENNGCNGGVSVKISSSIILAVTAAILLAVHL